MCFDLDSLPPVPVIRGAAVSHRRLELEAADGNRFAAFEAQPDEPGSAAVVVLPDVRGLYRFYEELALRFAERRIGAVAIDYFGRTAGVDTRGDDFEYRPHVDQTTPEGVQADVAAAVAHLRGEGYGAIFTVGFCFGGKNSWLAATAGHGLAGAIGFYGRPIEPVGIAAPIFDEALDSAGVEHEVVIYDGAPHSFFDRKQEEFAEASEDAWRRTLEFVERHA